MKWIVSRALARHALQQQHSIQRYCDCVRKEERGLKARFLFAREGRYVCVCMFCWEGMRECGVVEKKGMGMGRVVLLIREVRRSEVGNLF